MYLLNFLRGDKSGSAASSSLYNTTVEYRLACSGELYNGKVLAFDWRKSDATRILLRSPFEMFVVSRPFNSYPQELALRFAVDYVREESGNCSSIFLPDEEIVEDLCAVLTLLSRRVISPVVSTRQKSNYESEALGSFCSDLRMPLLPVPRFSAWQRRPISIVTGFQEQRVISYDPPPVGVDPGVLHDLLVALAANENADVILRAARLYKTAMELIEQRPDIAYQLLISTAEALANIALPSYQPEQAQMIESKKALVKLAINLGLKEDQAQQIALEACKGNPWSKRKFRKFLTDYASAEIWEEDPLFIVPENLRPDRLDFEKVLGSIYEMRSQSLHAGSSFPRSVGLGTSPSYAVRDLPRDMFKKADIPAVAWFERAVSKAAQNLLREQTGVDAPPFAAQAVAPRNLRDVERRVEDHKAGTGAAQEANIADPIRPHGEAQGAPERVSVGSAELFVRSRIVALRHP